MTSHDGVAKNPVLPHLAGLEAGYVATQLKLFRDGSRGGTSYHHVMAAVAGNLEDTDTKRWPPISRRSGDAEVAKSVTALLRA